MIDTTLYVFVRQDLPIEQQMVQAMHAVFEAPRGLVKYLPATPENSPRVVVIGMPDLAALVRVEKKLLAAGVHHYCWSEPDRVVKNCGGLGLTAIATAPLTESERLPLANYRLWRYSPETEVRKDSPLLSAAMPGGGAMPK